MCFSISWGWEPRRGERGLWAPWDFGDKGAPSINHWSLRDFLWSEEREKESESTFQILGKLGL
ncbi:hypothetical protein EYF80_006201 [Liparis tanakae]|uniref:Uncharacterized protein n=1 Tax=Liparis tanakae TaxID=230148 RepID=A0A4Z2J2H8_9TELE|nr:hypothetical protein EYF80_006201 [Liparis tanakae]